MPTPYTGDPVGSNAPSPVPGPENLPIVNIPLGPEGRTVSSISQALKTLTDHIAWLKKPFGSTTVAQRFQQRWRTAVGHTRFALDRNGLPAGTYMQMQEVWGWPSALAGPSSAFLPNTPQWNAVTSTTATGLVFVHAAGYTYVGVPNTRTGILRIVSGDVLHEFYGVLSRVLCAFHDDADISFETVASAESSSAPSRPDLYLGLSNLVYLDPTVQQGAYFWRDLSQPNWQAVARDGSGVTVVDTGVAVSGGAFLRFVVQYRGANVNDGAAKGAYFYISGILVATITTNVPTDGPVSAMMLARNVAGVPVIRTGAGDMYVGPVNLVSNVMPSVTT